MLKSEKFDVETIEPSGITGCLCFEKVHGMMTCDGVYMERLMA